MSIPGFQPPPGTKPQHFKVLTSTPAKMQPAAVQGIRRSANNSPSQRADNVYDYETALTRFSNGFMADPNRTRKIFH